MKILLCTPTFDNITHGPSKFANILLQINDIYPDCELRILTENIPNSIPNSVYKININYPRPVHSLGIFLRMFTYHARAKKIREEYDYDILLYNNAIMGLWSAIRMKKKVKTIGMLNDDDYLSAKIKDFNFSKLQLIFLIHKPFECIATKLLDVVIVNSNYLKKVVCQEYQLSPKKVQRLYKSIQLKKVDYHQSSEIDLKKIKVLFVKSDYKRGGLQILIQALSLLKKYSFITTIIGPLQEEAAYIETFFYNIKNVTLNFLGPQSQSEVFNKMKQHDILCIPSLREGLGVANIEGLAAGISVVSTKVGGIPEVLDSGKNGWLATKESPENLAKIIQICIQSPEERQRKSERGRQFVEQHFGHYQMLERFLNIVGTF